MYVCVCVCVFKEVLLWVGGDKRFEQNRFFFVVLFVRSYVADLSNISVQNFKKGNEKNILNS